jgi:predicted RNA-binding protein associated with RNAse of E/G family
VSLQAIQFMRGAVMKRVTADRPRWRRVRRRRFYLTEVDGGDFHGHVSLLSLDEVTEPLWVGLTGRQVCIADAGYSWLQHFPTGARHTLTTMFDPQGCIVEWYVDICRRLGLDERGVPWYEDLYLDILISPEWEVEVIDADDLESAWRQGLVTTVEREQAWGEANALLAQIRQGSFRLPFLSRAHREMLLRSAEWTG